MLFFQGVRRLFVLAFNNTTVPVPNNPIDNTNNSLSLKKQPHKIFFPRVNITNYNVLINGRNVYHQPTNDLVEQYNEIRKTATGDDFTTAYLLDSDLLDYSKDLTN